MTEDKLRIVAYKAEIKRLAKRIVKLEHENMLQKRVLKELGVKSITMTRTPAKLDAISHNGCKISL